MQKILHRGFFLSGVKIASLIIILVALLSCGARVTDDPPVSPADTPQRVPEAAGVFGYIHTTCAEDIEIYGNTLYVADGPGGIRVIDITNRANPVLKKTIKSTYGFRLYVNGDHLYVCDGPAGVLVFSLTNPLDPQLTFSDDTEWASSAAFHNGMLFLGDTFAGFRMYSLDVPGVPSLIKLVEINRVRDLTFYKDTLVVSDTSFGLGTYFFFSDTDPACTYTDGSNLGNFEDIVCNRGFAYVARNDEAANVEVFYIDDLLRIGFAAERFPALFIDGLGKYEDTLLISCGEEGVKGYDISNPPGLSEMWAVDTPGYARRSKIVGEYLYVADISGVCIYKVDPTGGVL